jgi:hypothetical protein
LQRKQKNEVEELSGGAGENGETRNWKVKKIWRKILGEKILRWIESDNGRIPSTENNVIKTFDDEKS